MNFHTLITLPLSDFKPEKTKYPIHRKAAHKMIYDGFDNWIMVHAFVLTDGGVKSTAWLEHAGKVFDTKSGKTVTKKSFYASKAIITKFLFTFKEVKFNLRYFRRYGNWENQ